MEDYKFYCYSQVLFNLFSVGCDKQLPDIGGLLKTLLESKGPYPNGINSIRHGNRLLPAFNG